MTFKVVPKVGVDTGIESVREILPKCVFDDEKCAEGYLTLRDTEKSGMTSADAGKTNLFTITRRTVQMVSATLP